MKGDHERGEMSWRRLLDLLSPSEQAKDWSNSMSSSGTHELMIWSRPADCNLLREGQVPRVRRGPSGRRRRATVRRASRRLAWRSRSLKGRRNSIQKGERSRP